MTKQISSRTTTGDRVVKKRKIDENKKLMNKLTPLQKFKKEAEQRAKNRPSATEQALSDALSERERRKRLEGLEGLELEQMKAIESLIGEPVYRRSEGGPLELGMKGALTGAGLGKIYGKSKIKVEKPKEKKGKGSADPLTGKLVRTYSVKEKEQMKERAKDSLKAGVLGAGVITETEKQKVKDAFKIYPSAYKRTKGKPSGKLTGGQAKIDMNKNNKIDAEDFKMLRGEEPKKLSQGGGIAIKGTKFKGVF